MRIVTLGIYSQKVTIFVLFCCRRQPNPRNTNLLRRQTPRNAVSAEKFLHALLFSKSGQIKKGFASLFSKSDKDFKKRANKKVRKNLKWVAYAEV